MINFQIQYNKQTYLMRNKVGKVIKALLNHLMMKAKVIISSENNLLILLFMFADFYLRYGHITN